MKFFYPEKDHNLDQRKTSTTFGHYPLSSYNTWHGGVHVESPLAALVAISDARIIAFRLPSVYLESKHECPETYSNGFILLQHEYKSPKGHELTFYSLYHHIASQFDIETNNLEIPDYLSEKVTKIKAAQTPKGVRGRSASAEKEKKRGPEIVLIPKNHMVTRNSESSLADWAISYNTKKSSEKQKYYSYTYTDPFTNTIYEDIHIHSNCLKLVSSETNEYRVTYGVDTNTTTVNGNKKTKTAPLNPELKNGALCYDITVNGFEKLACIDVIPTGTKVSIIEGSESEDKKWVKVKSTEREYRGYVEVDDLETLKSVNKNLTDKIIACDIPVKAGDTVAYVGAFGFRKNEKKYASHVELFTDDPDEDVSSLLDNCAGDGEDRFLRYKVLSGARLEPNLKSKKVLKAGIPVEVMDIKEDYVKVKVNRLIKVIDKKKHLITQHRGENSKGVFDYIKDNICNHSRTRYKIKASSFEYVNKQFNGLLTKGDYVYFYTTDTGNLRKIIIEPPFWDQEFWIDKSLLKLKAGGTVTSGVETVLDSDSCHVYPRAPLVPHENGNTFKKDIVLKGKPEITITDDDGQEWYFIKESYNHEKTHYLHTGWLKAGDLHTEDINPFIWRNFGFDTFDAGNEYVYAMKDYHKSPKTDVFIDEVWKIVDEDGNGVLTPMEFLCAQHDPEKSERMGKMVVKHKSEWSYTPEKIKTEAQEFYKLGIDLEKDQDKKKLLEQKRDAELEHLVEKTTNLMFWQELQNTTYTPKTTEKDKEYEEKKRALEKRYKRYYVTSEQFAENNSYFDTQLDELDQEYKKGKYKEEKAETRRLPSSDMLWHFNVNSFVRQMRGMYLQGGGDCYCNRDLTVEEFSRIIKRLRKSEGLGGKTIFNHSNCLIPDSDKTYERLTEEFNKTTKRYNINKCIQKIQFISQIYWESGRFTTALEISNGERYNPGNHSDSEKMGNTIAGDGPKYRGRGFMQLTWRNTQIKYLKEVAKDTEGELKGKTDNELELRENNYEKYISDNLHYAMDSAGWFWTSYKKIAFRTKASKSKYVNILGKSLNEVALYDDKYVNIISTFVNGGGNGKIEREKYYNVLKQVFRFDYTCVNNENRQEIISGDKAPWIKFVYQEYLAFKGVKENESPLKEKIIKYHKSGRGSGDYKIPWCASFVNWCFEQANYKNVNSGSNSFAFDWGPEANELAKEKSQKFGDKNLSGWAEGEACEAFVGAVIVLDYSHCAVIVGKNTPKNKYVYIGGNQGKGIQEIKYGTVSIGKEYAIMKPISYEPNLYELPELNKNEDGSYATTH
ncbi:hypothetical protein F6U93_11525 [Tamlana haliotis]|uniref:EF-hand domain-containing protein n=1 Tax=Pseudotamlana haliotis TaxID=2614804 RepID=A0A6N6MCL3_9FLAO|nr:hypothetical protein [Tamlana haliotis]KAB1067045.1 hypothetical protein F6U93_11525 [Tamlana haliotis]